MANREVCEVFIEQEIREKLESGVKPYSIGKDLSKWLMKFVEVRITPKTIEKRAQRVSEKIKTNVLNDASTCDSNENEEQLEEKELIRNDLTKKGTLRKRAKGAGRPKLKKEPETYVSYAERYVDMAISQLDRIETKDPERIGALTRLLHYVEKLLEQENNS